MVQKKGSSVLRIFKHVATALTKARAPLLWISATYEVANSQISYI